MFFSASFYKIVAMELYLIQELQKELEEISQLVSEFSLREDYRSFAMPKFGEIWICRVPVLVSHQGEVLFDTIARPVLIVDDTHEHFIKHDLKNYYVLKITSQKDSYQRIKINDYKQCGLQKEPFVRLEIPLKVERCQLLYKIGKISVIQAEEYVRKVRRYIQNSAVCHISQKTVAN